MDDCSQARRDSCSVEVKCDAGSEMEATGLPHSRRASSRSPPKKLARRGRSPEHGTMPSNGCPKAVAAASCEAFHQLRSMIDQGNVAEVRFFGLPCVR